MTYTVSSGTLNLTLLLNCVGVNYVCFVYLLLVIVWLSVQCSRLSGRCLTSALESLSLVLFVYVCSCCITVVWYLCCNLVGVKFCFLVQATHFVG